jgi:dimeric dUTPase (all-alpha-NTP-PPase superfamily)
LHARQCAASRRAYTDPFHVLLSFSLAKVHRKTENTIQSYQFSFKIAEYLSFIRLFTAVSQFLVEIHTSRMEAIYRLSCLPSRGVRLPSIPLGFAAYMSVASLKN